MTAFRKNLAAQLRSRVVARVAADPAAVEAIARHVDIPVDSVHAALDTPVWDLGLALQVAEALDLDLIPAPCAPSWDTPDGRPGWDDYFLGVANAVSTRADCTRRRVGAVLVDDQHRIVGTGYNGAPSGVLGCLSGGCPRGLLTTEQVAPMSDYDSGPGRCIALHAEVNAVLHAVREARGTTCYVNHEPCGPCIRTLAGAGVARVVWPAGQMDPVLEHTFRTGVPQPEPPAPTAPVALPDPGPGRATTSPLLDALRVLEAPVGRGLRARIAQRFGDARTLLGASYDDLLDVRGIGPARVTTMMDWLTENAEDLLAHRADVA